MLNHDKQCASVRLGGRCNCHVSISSKLADAVEAIQGATDSLETANNAFRALGQILCAHDWQRDYTYGKPRKWCAKCGKSYDD